MWITIASLVGFVLVSELFLWKLFRRHVDPVVFPSETDTSQIGFFSVGRLRIVALIHTIVLCVWIIFSVWYLW